MPERDTPATQARHALTRLLVIRRLVCLIISGLLALRAFENAAAIVRKANPGQDPDSKDLYEPSAVMRLPGDSRATAVRAKIRVVPLASSDLRALAELSPDTATQLYLMSNRVSRRDAGTQLALMAKAMEAREFSEVAHRLDVVASVNQGNTQDLFQGMMPQLVFSEFRRALRPYRDRAWFTSFVGTAIQAPGYLNYAADLIDTLQLDLSDDKSGILTNLLSRYVERGDIAGARTRALALAHLSAVQLDAFGLSGPSIDPRLPPLAWTVRNDAAVSATFDHRGGLDIVLQAGRSASPLSRTTTLTEGRYRLTFAAASDASGPPASLRWLVRCADDPEQPTIWQQPVPLGMTQQRFSAVLAFTGCSAQIWQLLAVAPDGQAPSRFSVRGLALTKLP